MKMPNKCPSCGGKLVVTRMECVECAASVEGTFPLCSACTLDEELRELFEMFMETRGNLKEMQRILGVSYPTVRNRVERMFTHFEESDKGHFTRNEVLSMLKEEKISVEEATEMLKDAGS